MSGTTHDEARLTTMIVELLAARRLTPDDYHAALRATFDPDTATAIAREYAVPAGGDAGLAFATMDTDRVFTCPQLQTGRALATRTAVHAFEFADPHAPPMSPYYSQRPAGAAHTSELAYLFDLRGGGPYQGLAHAELTPAQRELSATMIDIWAGFARSGQAAWPGYPAVRSLAPHAVGPVDAWADHHCAFWSEHAGGSGKEDGTGAVGRWPRRPHQPY